ncbi:hypothetical protein F2Q69_00012027 [Brassica cretica]|uniref:Uncharacterized protein n=1 Tax=Brassica cretica TaxID=69181 RepID=A0A8S9R4I8_BRACR|nr:hypothetical protein F2Q69_00012027 [Brassica cretica]
MALRPNTLMDVDIDFFALGKDRLNISSYPYDKTLWILYSSRPFCYARSLRDLIVGLQPDG